MNWSEWLDNSVRAVNICIDVNTAAWNAMMMSVINIAMIGMQNSEKN